MLLHFLVAGAYPVAGRTLADISRAHAIGERRRLRDLRPDLPDGLVRVIERATSADPNDRYDSAGEFEAALASATPLVHAVRGNASPTNDPGTAERRPGSGRRRAVTACAILALLLLLALAVSWRAPTDPAPPPFDARDWVLVAAFDNRTGESTVDGTLEYALERELADSRFVNVVPRVRVDDALRLMRRPPGLVLDPALAREVCVRDGVQAFITGRVDKAGTTFTLTARIVEASLGRTIGSAVEEASGAGAVGPAIQRLSDRVRELLGERRDQIQAGGRPPEPVTTPSLEAWMLYSKAVTAGAVGNWSEAARLAENAIAEDPSFASAHAWLARSLRYERKVEEAIREIERASDLMQSARPRERLSIAALDHFIRATALELSYNRAVAEGRTVPEGLTDEIHRRQVAATTYLEALLDAYPDDYWAASDLTALYGRVNRPDDAMRMTVNVARLRPADFAANYDAAQQLLWFGKLADAAPLLARARALLPPNVPPYRRRWLQYEPVFEDWVKGDVTGVVQRLDALSQAGDSGPEAERDFNLALGRLRRAESLEQASPAGARPDMAGRAVVALHRGDLAEARRWARQIPPPTRQSQPPWDAWLYVRVGFVPEAERLVSLWESSGVGLDSPGFAWAKGEVALARGRLAEATRDLRVAVRALVRWYAILAAESLAEALEGAGQQDEACRVLEEATGEKARLYGGPPRTLLAWMRARAQQAETCRRAGRAQEAQQIEAELRRLLILADPDFRPLVSWNREPPTH